MATLIDRCKELWDKVSHSPAQVPTQLRIPADHVDKGPTGAFQKDVHYFEVRVNEMFLSDKRLWFKEYLPMVMVISQFQYGGGLQVVPFLVGPNLIEKDGVTIPKTGMLFRNTRVAGRHPYKGGQLALSVILYRVERNDYARKLLQVMENTAGLLDFATALGTYVKVANVVLDGLDALAGSVKVEPVVGIRWELDPSEAGTTDSGYFALINRPEGSLEQGKLWVQKNQLLYGGNPIPPSRPADADYVLYSVLRFQDRNDCGMLPFQDLWQRVQDEANQPKKEHWESAKVNMASLVETMNASPDLTQKHADDLIDTYLARMKVIHKRAVEIATMGGEKAPEGALARELDRGRKKALAVLDL